MDKDSLRNSLKQRGYPDDTADDILDWLSSLHQGSAGQVDIDWNSLPPYIEKMVNLFLKTNIQKSNTLAWVQGLVTLAVLLVICFLSYNDILDSGATSALIGSVIGYTLGKGGTLFGKGS